jgi:hypothetical protein
VLSAPWAKQGTTGWRTRLCVPAVYRRVRNGTRWFKWRVLPEEEEEEGGGAGAERGGGAGWDLSFYAAPLPPSHTP